jgi:uncharacterized protein YacL
LEELQSVADSSDPQRRQRGRRGLDVLGELREIRNIDLRINESEAKRGDLEAKLVFIASSLKAKLITTDQSLIKIARFQGVICLHPGDLARAVQSSYQIGEVIDVEVVKPGKDEGQAVGYLADGSMVVVNDALASVGQTISAEIISVLPSGAGRIVFASMLSPNS